MDDLKPVVMLGCVIAIFACHGRAGTHPEDMSAKGHDTAAADAEAKAVKEASQYDPNVIVFDVNCSKYCFRGNPTEAHLREANRLRREAERHREASHDLRVAEERACSDIPELHRDFSPFYHRDHIIGADIGASGPIVVHFDRIPRTTAAELQRLVDCHLARNAAVGFEIEEMDYCPLAIPGVSATVIETRDGFDVQLDAREERARGAVASRVQSLLADE